MDIEPITQAITAAFEWGNGGDETETNLLMEQAVAMSPPEWKPLIYDLCTIAYNCGRRRSYDHLKTFSNNYIDKARIDKELRCKLKIGIGYVKQYLEAVNDGDNTPGTQEEAL